LLLGGIADLELEMEKTIHQRHEKKELCLPFLLESVRKT
jgi:hypothetical protein